MHMAAIGVLTLELRLQNSHSLKDKRHVVQSLKTVCGTSSTSPWPSDRLPGSYGSAPR